MSYVFIRSMLFALSAILSDTGLCQAGSRDTPASQTIRQHVFVKNKSQYLNVSRIGTFTVYDAFDCTFACLSNPRCFSVNLAASKGTDGKLWCELMSSDEYRNFKEYSENKNSHHFSIASPCFSSPCQNEGTCVTNYKDDSYECLCKEGFRGEHCKNVVGSCRQQYDVYKSNSSQVVTMEFDSKPISVLCHMGDFGCGDGGWTPVIKIDGNKNTFHYQSAYWSNKIEYNLAGGGTGFDSQETKLPTYWNTSFSKICLGMKIGQQINFIVIDKKAESLYSLIADGEYRATLLGQDRWKRLIGPQASLQLNCKREGFNVASSASAHAKARIGIIRNNENDCGSCDSRIGFGTGGLHDDSNTCGNAAVPNADIKAMGYILVQ